MTEEKNGVKKNPIPLTVSDDEWANLPAKDKESVTKAVAKYGDNKWWLSEDPAEIARYQLFEPILLVPFGKFHEGTEKLLGRPVYTTEFALSLDGLKKEANAAIALLDSPFRARIELPPEEVEKKLQSHFDELEKYCEKHGKKMLKVPVEGELEDKIKDVELSEPSKIYCTAGEVRISASEMTIESAADATNAMDGWHVASTSELNYLKEKNREVRNLLFDYKWIINSVETEEATHKNATLEVGPRDLGRCRFLEHGGYSVDVGAEPKDSGWVVWVRDEAAPASFLRTDKDAAYGEKGVVPSADIAEQDRIENISTKTLLDMGCQWWSTDQGLLLLTPAVLKEHVAVGTVLTSINNEKVIVGADYIDDDTRYGLLAYGILRTSGN
jgi:hypothetical protein